MVPRSPSRDVPLCLPLCGQSPDEPRSIPHNIASSKTRDMEVAALSDGGQERAEYKITHPNSHVASDIANVS
jgi:hypothetical protein